MFQVASFPICLVPEKTKPRGTFIPFTSRSNNLADVFIKQTGRWDAPAPRAGDHFLEVLVSLLRILHVLDCGFRFIFLRSSTAKT